jgi:hypothetical protein
MRTALSLALAYINTGRAESLTRGPGDRVGPPRDLCADGESGKRAARRQVMTRRWVDPGPRPGRSWPLASALGAVSAAAQAAEAWTADAVAGGRWCW